VKSSTLTSPGGVWDIKYHIVWCPKYRKPLPKKIQDELKTILFTICAARRWEIQALEVMAEHIHIFLKVPPTVSPAGIVKILKGVSAKILFETHPSLRDSWTKGHLWSPSYYLGSVGHVSQATVKKYIETQKKRAVGRPPLVNSSND
jgi:putative transposase